MLVARKSKALPTYVLLAKSYDFTLVKLISALAQFLLEIAEFILGEITLYPLKYPPIFTFASKV
jgi:hypothetical protein